MVKNWSSSSKLFRLIDNHVTVVHFALYIKFLRDFVSIFCFTLNHSDHCLDNYNVVLACGRYNADKSPTN
jgi:hypothetical protein